MTDSNQDSSDAKQVGHAYSWLNDHGQITIGRLMELARSGTSESLERLRELADDNNIPYDQATDPVELAEKISRAMEADPNAGVE